MRDIAGTNRGNALFRNLLLAALTAAAFVLPAVAQDAPAADPQLAKIATMTPKDLDVFMVGIASAVNQDALKLKGFAQTNDCLDLIRAANSFELGYRYLGEVRDIARKRTEREAPLLAAKAVQIRVVAFASRVRAEEWLTQRCRDYTVPADQASDPRYKTPAKVSNAEYTDAVIEARQTAETNLAIAVNAGISGKCQDAIIAGQNIALLLPYVQKLLTDTAKKPEVLGPRASRRGLEVSRRQLTAALDKLQGQFGVKCKAPQTDAPADPNATPADPAPETKPAQ
jgi:hypothetical protein